MSLNLVPFPCARKVAVLSLITVLCYSYDKDVSIVQVVNIKRAQEHVALRGTNSLKAPQP